MAAALRRAAGRLRAEAPRAPRAAARAAGTVRASPARLARRALASAADHPDEPESGAERPDLLSLLELAVRQSDCQPAVRLRRVADLEKDADEHVRVLSLLPKSLQAQLVSAAALNLHKLRTAEPGNTKRTPEELATGIVLLTSGEEGVLAPHVTDALAWRVRANSLICSTSTTEAPGSLKEDLSPYLKESTNTKYIKERQEEAFALLTDVLRPDEDELVGPTYVVCISQELLLHKERKQNRIETPFWLQLVERLTLEVRSHLLAYQLFRRLDGSANNFGSSPRFMLASSQAPRVVATLAVLAEEKVASSSLGYQRGLGSERLKAHRLGRQVPLFTAAWQGAPKKAIAAWEAFLMKVLDEQKARTEERILRANLRLLTKLSSKLELKLNLARVPLDYWPQAMRSKVLSEDQSASVIGMALHFAQISAISMEANGCGTSTEDHPEANETPTLCEDGMNTDEGTKNTTKENRVAVKITPAMLARAASDANEGPLMVSESGGRGKGQRLSDSLDRNAESLVVHPSKLGIDFESVGGLNWVKDALNETVMLPLMRPELFRRGNLAKPCPGLLIYGPPGTGKTMVCRALAGECNAHFMSFTRDAMVSQMYGESETRVRKMFDAAKAHAPTVILLDEIDSLLSRRSDLPSERHDANLVNVFLSAWDDAVANNSRVIVVGTTNRPDRLDEAVLRRMPRRLFIDLPCEEQRRHILATLLREEECNGVDVAQPVREWLATERVKKAAVSNDLSSRFSWKPSKVGALRPLHHNDFVHAKQTIRPSVSIKSAERDLLARFHVKFGEGT